MQDKSSLSQALQPAQQAKGFPKLPWRSYRGGGGAMQGVRAIPKDMFNLEFCFPQGQAGVVGAKDKNQKAVSVITPGMPPS